MKFQLVAITLIGSLTYLLLGLFTPQPVTNSHSKDDRPPIIVKGG